MSLNYVPFQNQDGLLGGPEKRAWLAPYLKGLPDHIQAGLKAKRLQIVDYAGYVHKAASAVTTVKMFVGSDTLVSGTGNIAAQKLEKDTFVLICGIGLLAGVSATISDTVFDTIPAVIANGDFDFTASGGKEVLPKRTSLGIFRDAQQTAVFKGGIILSNPKWLEPEVVMEFNMNWGTATAANTNVRLDIRGYAIRNY